MENIAHLARAMAKSDQLIEEALSETKHSGIKIITGGPLFHWDADFNLIGCDALGAVIVKMGEAKPGFAKGWLKRLCDYLDEDTYWLWRFNIGFAFGNHFYFIVEKEGKVSYIKDKVSDIGVKLRKKYYDQDT